MGFGLVNGFHSTCDFWQTWIFLAFATAATSSPHPSWAQDRAVHDQPRALTIFEQHTGLEMFTPERHGTLADPKSSELGFFMVFRTFRTICQRLEAGEPLDTVMPEGFAVYNAAPYDFGPDVGYLSPNVVLSSTGDAIEDEEGGHPAIWLKPGPEGMTCTVQWRMAERPSEVSQAAIEGLLMHWVPWELALVQVSKPRMVAGPPFSDAIEWDRPCQDRWCPAQAIYGLSRGDVALEMTLNVTDVEGARP